MAVARTANPAQMIGLMKTANMQIRGGKPAGFGGQQPQKRSSVPQSSGGGIK